MMVFLHVFIAVTSLIVLSYSAITLSKKAITTGYVSVAATITSGLYLVWIQPARMLHVCTVGVLYLAVATLAIIATKVRVMRRQNSRVI